MKSKFNTQRTQPHSEHKSARQENNVLPVPEFAHSERKLNIFFEIFAPNILHFLRLTVK